MQTTIQTDLQLTAVTLHDKQPMSLVAHSALESLIPITVNPCEFLPATMLTLFSIAKLLLHCRFCFCNEDMLLRQQQCNREQ